MSGYIGNIPAVEATQVRQSFTATSGQTSFATLGYTPNYLDVYLNGVKLEDGVDFTATNGSDIVLTVGATAGDTVEMVAFSTFQSAELATVAITGDYGDLLNTPAPFDPNTLATVATTGSYTDLINIPANIVTDATYVHTDNNYTTTEKNKLAGIEAGATADQTAAEILTAIKTVDGAGSGLDADTLDGNQASAFALVSHTHAYVPERSRTDWNDGTVINNVIGQLAWKNYGNNHTIFDASASTSPSGTAVNNTNPDVYWTGSYPTLMGWNGANTYGVRVDVARYAESAGSAPASIPNAGDVGSYAFMRPNNYATYTVYNIAPGSTYAGSSLLYAGAGKTGSAGSGTATGTWRCMGRAQYYTTSALQYDYGATVWLRIS